MKEARDRGRHNKGKLELRSDAGGDEGGDRPRLASLASLGNLEGVFEEFGRRDRHALRRLLMVPVLEIVGMCRYGRWHGELLVVLPVVKAHGVAHVDV